MAVLREIAVPASYYAGPGVSANFTKSRMDTIRAFPNCPSRSKSLSSLTMKSDFARSAHSRIRLSSGSSLMTLSLAVGITRFVSLANLPRESCSISPRPLELVAQHTHGFVQNGFGNVDADISGPGMTDQQCSRSTQVQRTDVDAGINGGADHLARCSFRDSAIRRSMSASVFIPSAFARSRPYPISPSRERSSKYCLTAPSSSSAGSLLWARAASSNCFASSPESGRLVVDMASSVLLSHVSQPTLSPVVGSNVSRCGVWLCIGGLFQSCPLPVVQLAVRTLPVGARFASRL